MKVIRSNIWETNSSTSHSCVIMTAPESDEWKKGKLYYYQPSWWHSFRKLPKDLQPIRNHFYTYDEMLHFLGLLNEGNPENINPYEYGFISYNDWDNIELEEDVTSYTTPNGENVIIYCKYGYDG